MGISTDYRDSRKAAYQQYAVVSDFNACKLPSAVSPTDAAPLGVAFVAAALGLGICLGVNFANHEGELQGPDLFRAIRSISRDSIPQDVRAECFDSIREDERPKPGNWIAIWGGEVILPKVLIIADGLRFICYWLLRRSTCEAGWTESYRCHRCRPKW